MSGRSKMLGSLMVAYSLAGAAFAQVGNSVSSETLAYLDGLEKDDLFSGSVLVTRGTETVLSSSYGLANVELNVSNSLETKFRIGSITKQFTAMAILILQEQGLLHTEDTLSDHLDDIPDAWRDLTIHQLLTHTSGLMNPWALPEYADTRMVPATLDEILAMFFGQPLISNPGEEFNYTGLGYFVLAKVIGSSSGISYHKFLQQEIFNPLDMHDTGGDEQETVLPNRADGYVILDGDRQNAHPTYMARLTGGGDLYSTVLDLNKWNHALNQGRLISRENYERFYQPYIDNYAYGWEVDEINEMKIVRHSGSILGFQGQILRVPEAELCLIILTNSNGSNSYRIVNRMLEDLLN